jgi:tRNA A-37 threonylcarbamoyl transferase component Bud32/class 3 adenylate cyclase
MQVDEAVSTDPDPELETQAAELRALPKGAILNERFEVERRLGAGGMAAVYLVRDRMLQAPRALKIMSALGSESPDWRARFIREVEASQRVNHPNVVRAFDFHDISYKKLTGVPAMTLEVLPGGTLRQRMSGVVKRTLGDRLELLARIADGLSAIHREKLVHRDLKPENVLFDHDGRPKISDLGLARSPASPGSTQAFHTPAYAAPEQITFGDLTAQTDLYSFGVMAFEILSGRTPFADAPDVRAAHLRSPAPPLAVPGLRDDVARLVAECLSKEPSGRPGTAEETSRRLRAAIELFARPAGVLGFDVVGYSKLATGSQDEIVRRMNDALAASRIIARLGPERVLKVPAGDGAFVAFFEDAGAAWDAALDLAVRFKRRRLRVRLGLHFGNVKPVLDLNEHRNMVGGGITVCERVMSFGDVHSVLASGPFRRELVAARPKESPYFDGPYAAVAKHGLELELWNVVRGNAGRRELPAKLSAAAALPVKAEPAGHRAPPVARTEAVHEAVTTPGGPPARDLRDVAPPAPPSPAPHEPAALGEAAAEPPAEESRRTDGLPGPAGLFAWFVARRRLVGLGVTAAAALVIAFLRFFPSPPPDAGPGRAPATTKKPDPPKPSFRIEAEGVRLRPAEPSAPPAASLLLELKDRASRDVFTADGLWKLTLETRRDEEGWKLLLVRSDPMAAATVDGKFRGAKPEVALGPATTRLELRAADRHLVLRVALAP